MKSHRRAIIAGGILCGAAVFASSCLRSGAQPAAGTVPVTVRLEAETGTPGVALGQLVVNHYRASVDYQQGINIKVGPATPGAMGNIKLPMPEPGFDRVVRVRVANASSIRATLTVAGQTATQAADGSEAMFFLHTGPKGRQVELLSSTDLYEQNLRTAKAVALPPNRRPRQFVISTVLRGPGGDDDALEDGLQTCALLGINTLELSGFGSLARRVPSMAAGVGINRFIGATYSPPIYFDWAGKSNDAALRRQWAAGKAKELRDNGVPLDKVVYYQVAEEPNWYFPGISSRLAVEGVLPRFRQYLQQQGLSPAELGASSWNSVQPIMQSKARDLSSRKLFYWTMRFYSDGAADGLKLWGDGLRSAINPNMLTVSNMFNRVSRAYAPSPNQKIDNYKVVGPDTAKGGMDWMQVGRRAAPAIIWTEDWWDDASSPLWSFYGGVQYAAADLDRRNSVGGFISGRTLGRFGNKGAKLKALALVGEGAKYIYWGPFGPDPLYTEFSWSRTPASYGAVAAANGMIAAGEDLLYPGQPAKTEVALLIPSSAWYWDKNAATPYYLNDLQGTYFALRHAGYAVDFVDEQGIAEGVLGQRGYRALYVTAPNVAAKAQSAIASWVSRGGTAVFSGADAGGSDEYNTPTNTLNQARGVRSMGRDAAASSALGAQTAVTLDTQFAPPVNRKANPPAVRGATPLPASGARVVGRFGNGGTAATLNIFGSGSVYSFGFRPGSTYWRDANHGQGLPAGFNAAVRSIITAPLRAKNIERPASTSVPLVVASRLDSPQGTAVVLLNWSSARQDGVRVTVDHAAGSRVSLASGAPVQTQRNGGDLIATVNLAKNDADVLLIRR